MTEKFGQTGQQIDITNPSKGGLQEVVDSAHAQTAEGLHPKIQEVRGSAFADILPKPIRSAVGNVGKVIEPVVGRVLNRDRRLRG